MAFERGDGDARLVEFLIPSGEDRLQIELARLAADGEASVLSTTLLERADG